MVATLCTVQDVRDEVGVNANTTLIASDAWITRYIEKVEGIIVAETRIDWITDYSSLNANIKQILKECCATGTAKKVIGYDRGSFSNSDVELKIDMLHDDYSRTLKTLKDVDTQNLRAHE